MRACRLAGVVLISVVATAATTAVPGVVVERRVFGPDRMTRVTLFDNRVAVTSIRENGEQVFFRRTTLATGEYDAYLNSIERDTDTAGAAPQEPGPAGAVRVEISVNLPGHEARTFTYNILQVQDLSTSRLIATLDDLQKRVAATPESEEALRGWHPEVGDRVELYGDREAVVSEVRDNGLLVVEDASVGILTVIPPEERSRVIRRVIKDEE